MAENNTVGSIARLWRFPVKSMRGERLEQAEITERGIVGDRAYALTDVETGKVVSAKSVALFPELFACQAAFVEPPQLGRETPPVRIDLPDGISVRSDSTKVDRVLSRCFKRDVRLSRAAPAGLGSAADLNSPVPVGPYFDLSPLSILTTSTLKQFNEYRPQSRFDERRFRMNVIVETMDPGFVENHWVGHEVELGESTRLHVPFPDARCVMTTLAQEELPNDPDILRTLSRYNRIQVRDAGQFPCAGVYAVIVATGLVRLGDRVSLR